MGADDESVGLSDPLLSMSSSSESASILVRFPLDILKEVDAT